MAESTEFNFETYAEWIRKRSTANGVHFKSQGHVSPYASIEFPEIAAAVKAYEVEFPEHAEALKAHRAANRELYANLAADILGPGKRVREVHRAKIYGNQISKLDEEAKKPSSRSVKSMTGRLGFGRGDDSDGVPAKF